MSKTSENLTLSSKSYKRLSDAVTNHPLLIVDENWYIEVLKWNDILLYMIFWAIDLIGDSSPKKRLTIRHGASKTFRLENKLCRVIQILKYHREAT